MYKIFDILNAFFLAYGGFIIVSYLIILFLSISELVYYTRKIKHFDFQSIKAYKELPTISVVAPAYNEEISIIENIRSLLSLEYPNLEVIIVNDGSTDNTLQKVIDYYDMAEVKYAYKQTIPTKPIYAIYRSTRAAFSNLLLIDKANGGKADAMNVGINVARTDLFLAIDVDCVIDQQALLHMVRPFLEGRHKKVIAAGGVVRVSNSCKVKDGRLVKINFPKNFWARLQVFEYMRAFTISRMAFHKINGLLIVSGAFGLFDRNIVLQVNGYDPTTVGEDLELIIKMRKYMHDTNQPNYRVAYIPDPLCWTQVPSQFKMLKRQRNRWTRGSIDTIIKHHNIFLRPKYKVMGLVTFPYWIIFEWLNPFVEAISLIYLIVMIAFTGLHLKVILVLLVFVFTFALFFNSVSVLYEILIFNRYNGYRFIFNTFVFTLFELVLYHPLQTYFSLMGNYTYFIKGDKKGWGEMKRTAF